MNCIQFKTLTWLLLLLTCLALMTTAVLAQGTATYTHTWWTVDGGGGSTSAGAYSLVWHYRATRCWHASLRDLHAQRRFLGWDLARDKALHSA